VAAMDSTTLMDRLIRRGAAAVELALAEGLVRWVDHRGEPVAWARCSPTLSFEPAREALVWARAWPGLTGLDATPAPPGPPERRPVDGGFARRQADEAAQRIGRFNLPIPLGPPHDTTLYLAVGTITLGDWPDSPTRRATRREAAVAWAQEQLELVFHEVSGPRPAEARAQLEQIAALSQLSAGALLDCPEGEALRALSGRALTWAALVAADPLCVQVALRRERARWLPTRRLASAG